MTYGLAPEEVKRAFIRYAVEVERMVLTAWNATPPAHRYTTVVAVAIATLAEAVTQVITENNTKWEQSLRAAGILSG